MTEIVFDYVPTPKQRLFHESTARELLYGGAAGGGKSYSMVWDGYMRCTKYPKTNAYLFRRTFPELEQTLIATAQEIIDPKLAVYRAGEHKYIFKNGSQMRFCYLNEEADKIKYQGAQIQWLYFDELTHFSQDMYQYIRTRLRAPKRLGVTPVVRCASNPGGPGHSWVKNYFVDATDIGTKIVKHDVDFVDQEIGKRIHKVYTCQYIPATVRDNPYLTDDYTIELMMKPPKLRDALLYGKWDAFEGQAFPEFTNDPEHYEDRRWTHVIEPFEIPRHWPRWISFDHGYSDPFSFGAWAVGPDDRVYRYKELYGCVKGEADVGVKWTPSQIGDALAEWLEPEFREGIHMNGVADPAIWDQSRGYSIEEQIRNRFSGVTFIKGDNTRIAGRMQFHEYLKFDKDGYPMMYVFNNCRDFIRTIPTLVEDERKINDVDSDGEDHQYDEARYFLMSRKLPPRLAVPKPKKWYNPLDD